MASWQVQEAKARFTELIDQACTQGAQTISRHGDDQAIVLSIEDYRRLIAPRLDFKAHLLGGPKIEDPEVARDPNAGRIVPL